MTQPNDSPPLVDTHTHLDEPVFDLDREAVLAASRHAGVRRFINIGYKPERWDTSRSLREQHRDIEVVIGLHPLESASFGPELQRQLLGEVEDLRPVAIGEAGFDFVRAAPSAQEQERAFRVQLEIASHTGLPVVIHQREAADALMMELDRWQDLAPIVLHSFDGNRRLADWAIERRCYIGVGGLATKKAAAGLRELLKSMPTDRLLLETDSPYLAPPGTETRRNSPANLPLIAETLAPLWDLTGEDLCWTTTRNAESLFDFRATDEPLEQTRE